MSVCQWCGAGGPGRQPGCDCEARIQCKDAGKDGHWLCGICPEHNLPRFKCMCKATLESFYQSIGLAEYNEWKETAGKVLEAVFCEHKEMVATGYADLAWRCAKCGYVFGTL